MRVSEICAPKKCIDKAPNEDFYIFSCFFFLRIREVGGSILRVSGICAPKKCINKAPNEGFFIFSFC
jgi:hypothetical protein